MIWIEKNCFGTVLSHLETEYPNEGCGLLSGREGKVCKVHPVKNAEASPISYFLDPREELAVFKEMRAENLQFLGIYHSHPTSEAFPSEKDRSLAFYDDVFYLIVSLKDRANPLTRAFWIRDGKIEEDKIRWSE